MHTDRMAEWFDRPGDAVHDPIHEGLCRQGRHAHG